jgi:hypothetical protein
MIEVTEYNFEINTVPELARFMPLWDYTSETQHVNQIREQLIALIYGWA